MTEKQIDDWLAEINHSRTQYLSSDMAKVCWSEELKEEVVANANNCTEGSWKDSRGHFFRLSTQKADYTSNAFISLDPFLDIDDKDLPMYECQHDQPCSAAKAMITSTLNGMYCTFAGCGQSEINYMYCGIPADLTYVFGAVPFTEGRECSACPESEACENFLCVRGSCLAPPPTPVTSTTTPAPSSSTSSGTSSPTKAPTTTPYSELTTKATDEPQNIRQVNRTKFQQRRHLKPTLLMHMRHSNASQIVLTETVISAIALFLAEMMYLTFC